MDTIETSQELDTPEGIAISISMAGPVPRGFAWALDTLIYVMLIWVVSIPLSFMGRFGEGLLLIATFFLYWFYSVFFEVLYNGMTPGKKALGLKVLHDDGTPIGWAASINRNLLRVVDFLPFMYGAGLTAMLLNKKFQRLGDIVAGTVVVYAPTTQELTEITQLNPAPPNHALSTDEQGAILSFAERSGKLSEERCNELAALTGPLVENQASPLQHLLAIANWIQGRRT